MRSNENVDGSMERAISSLLIMSGDTSPDLVQRCGLHTDFTSSVKQQKNFRPSEFTERELHRIEEDTGLDLHRAWITRLPDDLLVVRERFGRITSSSAFADRARAMAYCYREGIFIF